MLEGQRQHRREKGMLTCLLWCVLCSSSSSEWILGEEPGRKLQIVGQGLSFRV